LRTLNSDYQAKLKELNDLVSAKELANQEQQKIFSERTLALERKQKAHLDNLTKEHAAAI
jgi:hypothetical protein